MRKRSRRLFLIGVAAFACFCASIAYGQRRSAVTDEQIVQEAQLVASGARVDIFQHGVAVDPALVGAAESALAKMETLLGRNLDESTLGPRVRIYVSASTTISHVWRGYNHPSDPKAMVFLSPRVAEAALRGANATYAHELAHLLTWRYASHTLREGLADYLALQIHPGAGVGPNPQGYASPPSVSSDIEEYLGTTRAPPGAVISDAAFRRAYYFASYRFVRYLIERAGIAVFLRLYDASDPESEFQSLYGASRKELVLAAAKKLY
jgi:hypothetical protein